MRILVIGACTVLMPILASCVTVDVKPDTVVRTNNTIIASTGASSNQARIDTSYHFSIEEVVAPFGTLHTVLAESDLHKPLIVACGGNAFQETTRGAETIEDLTPFGDVFLFDYPGLGRSRGSGKKEEYLSSIPLLSQTITHLVNKRASDEPLIFWGHSLGGGYCAALAEATPTRSILIMEGAFANYQDIADAKAGIFSPFVRARVQADTLQLDIPKILEKYHNPIVVVASKDDETIPFAATSHLVARLKTDGRNITFIVLNGSAHNGLRKNPKYRIQIRQALKALGLDG